MGGRQILSRSKGSVTIELFLAVPIVVLVFVAGLQVVGAARARIELTGAVREGARVAATSPDPAKAVSAVQAALPPGRREATRVSVSRPAVVGSPARVTATMTHELGPPFPAGFGVDLNASATMLVER